MKADVWFGKDVFKGIEDDEDLEEADVEAAIKSIKKKGGKIPEKAQKKPESPHFDIFCTFDDLLHGNLYFR